MSYWIHTASEHGGELFGPYVTLEGAGRALANLALAAFWQERHAIGERSYTIIAARSRTAAECIVDTALAAENLNE